jgi:hypothetical protein
MLIFVMQRVVPHQIIGKHSIEAQIVPKHYQFALQTNEQYLGHQNPRRQAKSFGGIADVCLYILDDMAQLFEVAVHSILPLNFP